MELEQTVPDPAERVEIGVHPDLPAVDVLLVEHCARRWELLHQTYTVATILNIERRVEWRYRNALHYHDADGIMLMEPGEVHANTHVTAPADFRVLFVPPEIMGQAAAELGLPDLPHLKLAQVTGASHPELRAALLTLHASMERPSTTLEVQARFAGVLRTLLEQCAEVSPRPTWDNALTIRRAREYIRAHASEPIALQDLADASGASSRFQLVRAFSVGVGLPPHAYQIQLRVLRARELLSAGVPPAQVATELGFVDQSHLSRHFSRVLGVTPSAYARATRPFRIAARTYKTGGPSHG